MDNENEWIILGEECIRIWSEIEKWLNSSLGKFFSSGLVETKVLARSLWVSDTRAMHTAKTVKVQKVYH